MNTKQILLAATSAALFASPQLRAQGSLTPSGPPAPTMRTLNELYEAVGQLTPLAPSAFVELSTSTPISAGNNATLTRVTKSGTNAGAYTVPAGKALVITDVEIFPEAYSATSILSVQLKQNTTSRQTFRIRGDRPFASALRTGIVFGPGFSLNVANNSPGGSPSFRIVLRGYVTNDE